MVAEDLIFMGIEQKIPKLPNVTTVSRATSAI